MTIQIAEQVSQNRPSIIPGVDAVYDDVVVDDYEDKDYTNDKMAVYAGFTTENPETEQAGKIGILADLADDSFLAGTKKNVQRGKITEISVSAGSNVSRNILRSQLSILYPKAAIGISGNSNVDQVRLTITKMTLSVKTGDHIEKVKVKDAIPEKIIFKETEVKPVEVTP